MATHKRADYETEYNAWKYAKTRSSDPIYANFDAFMAVTGRRPSPHHRYDMTLKAWRCHPPKYPASDYLLNSGKLVDEWFGSLQYGAQHTADPDTYKAFCNTCQQDVIVPPPAGSDAPPCPVCTKLPRTPAKDQKPRQRAPLQERNARFKRAAYALKHMKLTPEQALAYANATDKHTYLLTLWDAQQKEKTRLSNLLKIAALQEKLK